MSEDIRADPRGLAAPSGAGIYAIAAARAEEASERSR
jgi:hypothetical protein